MNIKDFIRDLQQFEQSLEVVIVDADTTWKGHTIHMLRSGEELQLSIEYHEMEDTYKP